MSRQLSRTHRELLPRRLGDQLERSLQHVEAHGLLNVHEDGVRLSRVEQAATHGLIAVAQISSLEASLVQVAPHAAGRLRTVADAGTIGIVGVVARAGF
jgi:hypothetical protein